MKQLWAKLNKNRSDEGGQSIVILAFMMVGLLAFAGLATDVGLLYVRTSQFDAAVDAAALAGVTEMRGDSVVAAQARALQFLNVNGWDVAPGGVASDEDFSELGIPQFALTVTLPVETYFMRLLGFDTVSVTRTATAAYYALADINTPTAFNFSQMNMANQFIYGPNSCTNMGDPVIPRFSSPGVPNPNLERFEEKYTYRIRIRQEYITGTVPLVGAAPVRVELFDPDSVNLQGGSTAVYTRSAAYIAAGNAPVGVTFGCQGWRDASAGTADSCIAETGEPGGSPLFNPLWIIRADEYWGGACQTDRDSLTGPISGNPNTVTTYELYYYNSVGQRIDVALYTADNSQANLTDLKWVSPGADAGVNTNSGSFTFPDATILPIDRFGMRYLYLDVRGLGGTTKNSWDLWARPPDNVWAAMGIAPPEKDVNLRNTQIANNTQVYMSDFGLTVYAIARMPVDPYVRGLDLYELPLNPAYTEQAGGTIYASVFDADGKESIFDNNHGMRPDIVFTFDTVGSGDFHMAWGGANTADPTNQTIGCWSSPYFAQCNNQWIVPQMAMGIPTNDDGVAFYGGNFMAEYAPGNDDHTWQITVTSGRPFLTR